MALEGDRQATSSRRSLKVAISALVQECGFSVAENSVLETLTEMLQSLLSEIGQTSRAYAEHAGRTNPMITDVMMSLIELGINIDGIPRHARRVNKSVFLPPSQSGPSQQTKSLQTGDKQTHPSYIPEHLPKFPDPHSYIRTQSSKPPINDYQIIREKAASQKRDVERALTRFIAKTGETQTLFKDDTSSFPLIAIKSTPQPYINALLPKDQDLDSQDSAESSEHRVKRREARETDSSIVLPAETSDNQDTTDNEAIDNPYLRPIKLPKHRKKIKILGS
ncbi:hypothetical protein ScPMuIL_016673 [Solemya velum]